MLSLCIACLEVCPKVLLALLTKGLAQPMLARAQVDAGLEIDGASVVFFHWQTLDGTRSRFAKEVKEKCGAKAKAGREEGAEFSNAGSLSVFQRMRHGKPWSLFMQGMSHGEHEA